jgi:hypothetical protein
MRAPEHDGEWTQQHVIKTHHDEKDIIFALDSSLKHMKHLSCKI